MTAAWRAPRQLAILLRADDLRDDLFASRALLPEGEEEVDLAVVGLPLQKRFEEALDLVGSVLRAAEYEQSHLTPCAASIQQIGERSQAAFSNWTAEEVIVKLFQESVVRPAAAILEILVRADNYGDQLLNSHDMLQRAQEDIDLRLSGGAA